MRFFLFSGVLFFRHGMSAVRLLSADGSVCYSPFHWHQENGGKKDALHSHIYTFDLHIHPSPPKKFGIFFFKSKISLTRLKQNFLQYYFVTK